MSGLFSRRVVRWSMSAAMTAQLVTNGKPDACKRPALGSVQSFSHIRFGLSGSQSWLKR